MHDRYSMTMLVRQSSTYGFPLIRSILPVVLFLGMVLSAVASESSKHYRKPIPETGSFQKEEAVYRFLRAMRMEDRAGMLDALRHARETEISDWMLAYGRELLSSCDENALLFTGTYLDTIVIWYAQYVDCFRTDITVIPIGLLNRPWFLMTLKHKDDLMTKTAPFSWTKEMIFMPEPDQFIRDSFRLDLERRVLKRYTLPARRSHVQIDLSALYSRQGGYMDENVAVLIDIIKTNGFNRPVCFTLNCNRRWMSRIRNMLCIRGLICELLPQPAADPGPIMDLEKTGALFIDSKHLLQTLTSDIPFGAMEDSVRYVYLSVGMELIKRYEAELKEEEAEHVRQILQRAFPLSLLNGRPFPNDFFNPDNRYRNH